MRAATAGPLGDAAEGVSVDKANGGANPEARTSIEGVLGNRVLKAKGEAAVNKWSRARDGWVGVVGDSEKERWDGGDGIPRSLRRTLSRQLLEIRRKGSNKMKQRFEMGHRKKGCPRRDSRITTRI
jgi:hypothetical protein